MSASATNAVANNFSASLISHCLTLLLPFAEDFSTPCRVQDWFAVKGDDPRPLFAFPGIWRRYQGPIKKDGPNVDIETYRS
jgi:hypothetical protein